MNVNEIKNIHIGDIVYIGDCEPPFFKVMSITRCFFKLQSCIIDNGYQSCDGDLITSGTIADINPALPKGGTRKIRKDTMGQYNNTCFFRGRVSNPNDPSSTSKFKIGDQFVIGFGGSSTFYALDNHN